MFRFTATIVRPWLTRATPRLITPKPALLFAHSPARSFASSHEWKQGPNHPLIDKIGENPHIMKQLMEFTQLLQSKGVDLSKQPNFMAIAKIMADPEVKEKTRKLVQDMQTAGIQLDMEAVKEIQESMSKQQNPFGTEKKEEKKEDEGLMGKMKGYFKK